MTQNEEDKILEYIDMLREVILRKEVKAVYMIAIGNNKDDIMKVEVGDIKEAIDYAATVN